MWVYLPVSFLAKILGALILKIKKGIKKETKEDGFKSSEQIVRFMDFIVSENEQCTAIYNRKILLK